MEKEISIVYEDENIRVIFCAGDSDFIILTFGDVLKLADGQNFFADNPVKKSNMTAIGIMPKRKNWYLGMISEDLMNAVGPIIAPYQNRVLYGGSMGGYAAVKFSAIFGATHVIALCPQWSIDMAECEGVNPGWQSYFSEAMKGMSIKSSDVSGRVFLFFDQFNKVDNFHGRSIANICEEYRFVNVPFVGHNVTPVFAGTDKLRDLIRFCMLDDLPSLRSFSRTERRKSPIWIRSVLSVANKKFTKIAGNIIRWQIKQGGDISDLTIGEIIYALRSIYLSDGFFEAYKFYESFQKATKNPSRQLMVCAYFAAMSGRLLCLSTYHNTRVVFSFPEDKITHSKILNDVNILIEFSLNGKFLSPQVKIGDASFCLAADEGGSLIFLPTNSMVYDKFSLEVVMDGDGKFALRSHGKFLSAEKNGRLVLNRAQISRWELFFFDVV